ncbi:unnamed protein product [Clonostachys byssicola]|uniref:Uncharacterized protein n=1 Tax=Clonostachys byssicola TaxID=160290 RepID=A0A9N9UX98_9HYPO|nr:unnamed protein product [Clonostachys byssicola]
MGRRIMDEDAMAAMEADRVAQAELSEYLERENGPSGGRGHSTVAYRREGDLSQAYPQIEAPDLRVGDAITTQPVASRDDCKASPPDSDDRDVCAPRPSAPLGSPTGSETPLVAITDEEVRNYRKASEYGDYHLLVSDGARPAYPVERVEEVQQNSYEYFDLLYRWSHIESFDTSPCQWDVFQRQLVRWEHFRAWQMRQRDKIDELSLEKFIEKRRTDSKRMADHIPEYRMGPVTPSRPIRKQVYKAWRLDQHLRRRDREFIRQGAHKPVGFVQKVEAIRRRLLEYGFAGHIDFDIDPKKQGQLATWAEYVDFELRWLSAYEAAVERAALEVEKTWQKYDDEGQFSKEETVQVLQSKYFKIELSGQKYQRQTHMTAAREAVARLRQQIESDSPEIADTKLEMLQAAEKRSQNADERYMQAVRKSAAASEIENKRGHQKYKELVAKQKALAQWYPVASGERKTRVFKFSEVHSSETTTALQDTPARQRSTGTLAMVKGVGSSPRRQRSRAPAVNDSATHWDYKVNSSVPIPSTIRQSKTGTAAFQEATIAQNGTGPFTGIMPLDIRSTICGLKHSDAPQVPQHDLISGEEKAQEARTVTAKTTNKRKRARTVEEMEASNERLESLRRRPHVDYSA